MYRVGRLFFHGWRSMELRAGEYSDTFIFNVDTSSCLPPGEYAYPLKRMARTLAALRRSASLWIKTDSWGWFSEELRRTLAGATLPFFVGPNEPKYINFSFRPWVDIFPSPAPPQRPHEVSGHEAEEIVTLRVLARLRSATTDEIAAQGALSLADAGKATKTLSAANLIEQVAANEWSIRRPGLSVGLRSLGLPPGVSIASERNHSGGDHRRVSRLWTGWLRHWPGVVVRGGWSEVRLPNSGRMMPDALAWCSIDGRETLCWLEAEVSHGSRKKLQSQFERRLLGAQMYASSFKLPLIFMILARERWMLSYIEGVLARSELPERLGVVLGSIESAEKGAAPPGISPGKVIVF